MYIESRFALRHEKLRQERHDFAQSRHTTLTANRTSNWCRLTNRQTKISDAATEIDGLPDELGDFAAHGLFDPRYSLHQHQYDAIKAAQNKHVVITAGTGSGKTEAFLIPVVARLLEESKRWPSYTPRSWAWWDGNKPRIPNGAMSQPTPGRHSHPLFCTR
ncbi:MAG: DEAD/DEAH box helicase [Chloroflexi bacterium]|nr:DEAD/DEAH box helicase [Chloroflexota bacterium]